MDTAAWLFRADPHVGWVPETPLREEQEQDEFARLAEKRFKVIVAGDEKQEEQEEQDDPRAVARMKVEVAEMMRKLPKPAAVSYLPAHDPPPLEVVPATPVQPLQEEESGEPARKRGAQSSLSTLYAEERRALLSLEEEEEETPKVPRRRLFQ